MKKMSESRILSMFMASILCIASFILPVSQFPMTAFAATRVKLSYPTNDLVRVPEPKTIKNETQVINGAKIRTRNSSNLNTGVSTGQCYRYLDETEKKLYRALMVASDHIIEYDVEDVEYTDPSLVPVALGENSVFSWNNDQFNNAYEAVRYDHPDLIQLTMCQMGNAVLTLYYTSSNTVEYNTYICLVSPSSYYTEQVCPDVWPDEDPKS
ncbi:hypothetical protein [Butyrivibrio sp. INlla16]|uniref:hypothetical protein n=1 Tax=Butyrivibrio sp. INlla16 TaxID=1520807 RepID=UPI00088EBCC0|nr:hypothetical protein [Butyrivibrio sp. INlla16]SDB29399.1 hypothetical protein SAMN02910263_01437 [Butyrivibrio sp. INlla16]